MLFARNGIDTHTKLCLSRPLANNSTSFLDGSLYNHTVTANGDAKWSNGSQRFRQNTMYFDGTGDYLSVADSDDFELGNGNFTIDVWVNFSTLPDTVGLIGKWDWTASAGASYGLFFWKNASNEYLLVFRWSATGDISPVTQIGAIVSVSTGQWYHCAVVRSSPTSTKLYLNGASIASTITDFSVYQGSTIITIGSALSNGSPAWALNGYIAMPTLSKGIARWTGNFTPPKNPYM